MLHPCLTISGIITNCNLRYILYCIFQFQSRFKSYNIKKIFFGYFNNYLFFWPWIKCDTISDWIYWVSRLIIIIQVNTIYKILAFAIGCETLCNVDHEEDRTISLVCSCLPTYKEREVCKDLKKVAQIEGIRDFFFSYVTIKK